MSSEYVLKPWYEAWLEKQRKKDKELEPRVKAILYKPKKKRQPKYPWFKG